MTPIISIAIVKQTTPQSYTAELKVDGVPWAEIHQRNNDINVMFLAQPDGKPWLMPYVYAVAALEDAKRQLYYAVQSAA